MFTGTYFYGLDRKGRVVIPAAFRRQFGNTLYLTRGPERCVLAVTVRQWQAILRRNARDPDFRGYFLTGAVNVRSNHEGRIQIPISLREWAELPRASEVAVVGTGSGVTICRRDRWDARLQEQEARILASLTGGFRGVHLPMVDHPGALLEFPRLTAGRAR